MEAIIFIGIQASGKSTLYRDRFFRTHVRISLDLLRTRHREQRMLAACLETGQPFVVDNTNPTRADRARYVGIAHDARYRVVGYYFRSALTDSVARNEQREGTERIPVQGIRATHARLELPSMDEGFDALYFVRFDEQGKWTIEEWRDEIR